MDGIAKQKGVESRFSKGLRVARNAYQKGDAKKSLNILDQLASSNSETPRRLAKIAGLVAHGEFKLGRYRQASHAFKAAISLLPPEENSRAWVNPALGQIRALLKEGRGDEARERAESHWIVCLEKQKESDEKLDIGMEDLRSAGKIRVSSRPVRPSVFASKLGNIFFDKAMFAEAGHYYSAAVEVNPNGSCRARQGLAKLALVTGDHEAVERRSLEALLLGKFHAKTISSWQLLIRSRLQLGKEPLRREDLGALAQIEETGVRERSYYTVIKELRKHGQDIWKVVVKAALRSHPGSKRSQFELELNKLLLSEARLTGAAAEETFGTSSRILRNATAQPADVCAAAKEYVRASCLLGRKTDGRKLARRFAKRWNSTVESRVLHSMAKGAILAREHGRAAEWLREICHGENVPAARRGRSRHALAGLEEMAGNTQSARSVNMDIASDPKTPCHDRIKALLKWVDLSENGERVSGVAQVDSLIGEIVSGEKRSVILLTTARELTLRGDEYRQVATTVLGQARVAVSQEIAESSHPTIALRKTLPLLRKLFYDFQDFSGVIELWDTFLGNWGDSVERSSEKFWNGEELRAGALLQTSRKSVRKELETKLSAPETPACGRAMLGRALIAHYIYGRDTTYALEIAKAVAGGSGSTHSAASTAHYWLAIEFTAGGDHPKTERHIDAALGCLGNRIALLQEWRFRARLLLLKTGSDFNKVVGTEPKFSFKFVTLQQAKLERDLKVMATR